MTVIYLDIEPSAADELYTYGQGFCRLAGYAVDDGPVVVTTDMEELVAAVTAVDIVVAHNGIAFDLAALHRYHNLDVTALVEAGRVRDTLLLARQAFPPLSGGNSTSYSLDAVAQRLGVPGKLINTGQSVLKTLKDRFGGYDRIPVDEPDYRLYLERDVEVLRDVAQQLPMDEYVLREHRVLWRLGAISRSGWRIDADEAKRRVRSQQERIEAAKLKLHQQFGTPVLGSKPHTTIDGKQAIEAAMNRMGVEPPRTPKGALALGREALEGLLERYPTNADLRELCTMLLALNGERTVAQTLLDHMRNDGRVHPSISAGQATGRVSVTRPGITVMGKRDRRNVVERSLLLPDKGDVLICCDLSQVDARAMAAHAEDPEYIDALLPGKDLHDEMAVALFGDWDRAASEHHPRRNEAKAITHATSYGMGARALAEQTGWDQQSAEALLNRLDLQYPMLSRLKALVRAKAEATGELTSAFGRKLGITVDKAYTQAPAAIGQGTARDILMEGILRLPNWLWPRLRAVVHDEIVLSVPVDRVDEAREAVLTALQFTLRIAGGERHVPILAECSEPGRDWADCYRGEKADWPEVARGHREMPNCTDSECTWHVQTEAAKEVHMSVPSKTHQPA